MLPVQSVPLTTVMTLDLATTLTITLYIFNLLTPLLVHLYIHSMAFQLPLPLSMSLEQRIRPHIPSQWHIDVGNGKIHLQWETKGLESELLDLLHNEAEDSKAESTKYIEEAEPGSV